MKYNKKNNKFLSKKKETLSSQVQVSSAQQAREAFYFFQLISTQSKLKFLVNEFFAVYSKYINKETGLLKDASVLANNNVLLKMLFLINDSLIWNQCVNSKSKFKIEENSKLENFLKTELKINLNLNVLKDQNKTLFLIFYWMLREIFYISNLYNTDVVNLENKNLLTTLLTEGHKNPKFFKKYFLAFSRVQKVFGMKANAFDQKYLRTFAFSTCNSFNVWYSKKTFSVYKKKPRHLKKKYFLYKILSFLKIRNSALLSLGLNKTVIKAQKFNLNTFKKSFLKYRLNNNLYKYSFLKLYLQRNLRHAKNISISGNILPMHLTNTLQFNTIKSLDKKVYGLGKLNPNLRFGGGLVYTRYTKRMRLFKHKVFFRFLKFFKYPKVHNNSAIKENNIFRIDIRIAPHNIFCTFIDLRSQQTLFNINGGSCNQNIPRKANKYYIRLILKNFIGKLRAYLKNMPVSSFVFRITCARHLRMFLLNMFKKEFLSTGVQHIVVFDSNKAFNGCRAKKAIRKKRRFGRVFK